MNPDVLVKKQIYVLLSIIGLVFVFADGITISENQKKIKSSQTRLKSLKDEKNVYDQVVSTKLEVEAEIEELKEPYLRLFDKFSNSETVENEISSILSRLTSKMIVVRETRKPKVMMEWVSDGTDEYTVPKLKRDDPDLVAGSQIVISTYETELEVKCNYFEFLEFLHALANQERYFALAELAINPDADIPYGINSKLKVRTYGFEEITALATGRR